MLLSKPTPKVKKPHKTIRVSKEQPQAITVTHCAQRGCKFYNKPAEQGVCYYAEGEILDWPRVMAYEKQVTTELRQIKRRSTPQDYVRLLEAYYVSAMVNWTVVLDEVVRLRRDNGLLQLKAQGLRGATATPVKPVKPPKRKA